MTDAETIATALTAVGGSLALALRWAVNRVTKSNDDGTAALIANTASNAVLTVKIDGLMSSNQRLADKIDGIGDFIDDHTPVGPIPTAKQRARTNPMGVTTYHLRPRRDEE